MASLNVFGQPIGQPLPEWQGAKCPDSSSHQGRYCRLERANVERHAAELYEAYQSAADASDWTYLSVGPFATLDAYSAWLSAATVLTDPLHYAVIDLTTGKAVGTLALMRIDVANGVIEIGHVTYSARMKRSRMATEALSLLMAYVFKDLGYRRLEWKCDSLNAPSRAAALRYGFRFEGVFRQAIVTRQRNRDTAWFSIIDDEYSALNAAYEGWLDECNFDELGHQIRRLTAFRGEENPDR